jgi:hypothetical protein
VKCPIFQCLDFECLSFKYLGFKCLAHAVGKQLAGDELLHVVHEVDDDGHLGADAVRNQADDQVARLLVRQVQVEALEDLFIVLVTIVGY